MNGPLDGEVMAIEAFGEPPEATFGRHDKCLVSLPDDPETSRKHARLLWRDGAWWIEDLGSTNGTFVGEFAQQRRISSPVMLHYGEIFRVGLSRFRLEALGDAVRNESRAFGEAAV
ncbi:MAG: FHA domain-containing protein [Vicinamibacteria bacterium]|nr:FHA domain-containing protein [Vicinamibacteria bacterium]